MSDTEKENPVVEETTENLDNTIKEKEELIKKQNELLEQQQKNLELAKKVLEQQQAIQEKQAKQNAEDPIEWFREKLKDAHYFGPRDNKVYELGERGKDAQSMDHLLSLYAAAYKKLHNLTDEEMFQRMADNVLNPMETGKFKVERIPQQ